MMIRIGDGRFVEGRTVPIVGTFRHAPPRLAQAPRPAEPPIVLAAREKRDQAAKHLRSAEDNLSALATAMGPEAALQALEEGRESLDQAQRELEDAIAEAGLKTGNSQ